MTNLMGTRTTDNTPKTAARPDAKTVARCKANGLTMVRLARESGKLNDAGLAMLDDLAEWLASGECQFFANGWQGDAPQVLDMSAVQDLYKAYKAAN